MPNLVLLTPNPQFLSYFTPICWAISLGAISVDFVSHLQYQFYNFNIAVVGMITETEFVTIQAHNGKQEVETRQRSLGSRFLIS